MKLQQLRQMVSERYEGVIQTFEDLDAVDGANVNVDAEKEKKIDVIAVPVAAVLQDGQGNDVVSSSNGWNNSASTS